MPLLRNLTLKIKTKLATPPSPPQSPEPLATSFRVVSGTGRRTTVSSTDSVNVSEAEGSSVASASSQSTTSIINDEAEPKRTRGASFLSDDGVSLHTNLVLDMASAMVEEDGSAKEKRRSRFREEF